MKRMKIICCLLCVAILMACALPVQAAGIRVAIDGEVCDIEWTLPTDGVHLRPCPSMRNSDYAAGLYDRLGRRGADSADYSKQSHYEYYL